MNYIVPINPLSMATEKVKELWERIKNQDYAFDDFTRNRPDIFCQLLLHPGVQFFEVGEWGLAYVTDLYHGAFATLHFIVWEPRTNSWDLIKAGKELIIHLLTRYELHRINAMIPEYNEQAERMAYALGFKREGVMKGAILNYGEFRDVIMMGLVRAKEAQHAASSDSGNRDGN